MMRLFAEGSSTAGPQSYRLDASRRSTAHSFISRHVEKETLETQSGSLAAEASRGLTGAELDTCVNRLWCFSRRPRRFKACKTKRPRRETDEERCGKDVI